jgi:hypothetical protein
MPEGPANGGVGATRRALTPAEHSSKLVGVMANVAARQE